MTNRNTNKNGVKLLAVLAVFAMAFAAVAVATSDSSDATGDATSGTDAVAKIGEELYTTLDGAIQDATLDAPIILLKDATLNSPLSDVTIEGSEHTITIQTAIALNNEVTINEATIAAGARMVNTILFYSDNYSGTSLDLTFSEVSFDSSCGSKSVYISNNTAAEFIRTDFTNAKIVYEGGAQKPSVTLDDVTNIDMNVTGGEDVEIGQDIITKNGTTVGNVNLVNTKLIIPAGESFKVKSVNNYRDTNGGAIENNGEFYYEIPGITPEGDGIVRSQGDSADRTFTNNITLGDGVVVDSASAIIASYTQEVIITGDVTVVSGGHMQILGKLTILENASLTIETGGNVSVEGHGIVDVKGDLIIEGTTTGNSFAYSGIVMTVSGSVSLEGKNSFLSTGEGIEISGTFDIGDEATAQLDGATILKDGTLTVNGIVTGEITNNGTIKIDSQGLEDGTKIDLVVQLGANGIVDIVNVYGTVTVSDSDLTFTQGGTTDSAEYDNSVVLTDVAGVKVTETLTVSEENRTYTGKNTMNISGTIITAVDYNATVVTGKVDVLGENVATLGDVVLGDKIKMQVDGEFTVSAVLTAINNGSKVIGSGEMTVEGKVTVEVPVPNTLNVNAAKYTTVSPAYTIYTTLETALADGATNITLMGTNSVKADTTIPVGTTVTMDEESKLTVSDKAVLTIEADDRNSARFVTVGVDTVDVKGTLIVINFAKSKVNEDSILSDTSKTVEKTRTYTNIYKALTDAAEGETVEITRGADLILIKDVEVKAGITLSIPEDEEVIVDNGVTVTVNGTIYAAGTYELSEASEDGSEAAGMTVVNGLFLYNSDVDIENYIEDIVGAYFEYSYTVGNSTVVLNAIAPFTSMPALMDKVESGYVGLFGKMDVGAVDFSAYDGERVYVFAFNQISFETITLGTSVAFVAEEYDNNVGTATGTLVLANGSVDVRNIMTFGVYNKTDPENVTTSWLKGYVLPYDDPETAVTEKGGISFNGAVTMNLSTTQDVSVFVPKDATVTVISGDLRGAFTVEGAMVVGGTSVVFQDLTVTGTVTAEGNNVAEAVKLFVGVTSKDFAMAGTGSVAGVTLVNSDSAVAYVSPNATVGEDITALKATEYYVEDALYLTAYANNGNNIAIAGVKFTIDNARFDGWMDEDGNILVAESDNDAVEVKMIGNPSKVYADITYAIFNVEVVVDSGIGAVAIDGNVLVNLNGNVFTTASLLKAGQHTITYTLKSGYTGEAVLSVNGDGATVSGMNFTLAGTPAPGQTIPVQLSLFGTTVSDTPSIVIPSQPAESDGDMGLTEYLLIVLVVLAAILVIIVSIRMMRS